jgi:electron transfer flavoprotein alpha subunit
MNLNIRQAKKSVNGAGHFSYPADMTNAPLFSDVVDIEAGDEVFFTRLPYTAKVIERATAAAPTVGDLSE